MLPLIAALLFALPLTVAPGNDDISALPQTVFLEVAVPLLWTIRLFRGAPPVGLLSASAPLAAALLWSAASLFFAVDPSRGLEILWRLSSALALALLVADEVGRAVPADRDPARRLLSALFGAAVVVSGLGLLQHLAGLSAVPQAYPPAGTLANRNVAAGFVAALLPFGAAVLWRASAPVASYAFAAGSGISLAYLVRANCRGALVAIAIEAVVALWILARRGPGRFLAPARFGAVIAGGVIAVFLLAVPSFEARQARSASPREALASPSLSAAAGAERAAWSIGARIGIWRNTLEMIRARPLTGVGLGGFSVEYPKFARRVASDGTTLSERVEAAHNDYLQALAELGVPGALFLSLGLLAAGKLAAMAWRDRSRSTLARRASALGGIGLLAQAMFFPTFSQPALLMAASVFVGVMGGGVLASRERCVDVASPARAPYLALAVCALVAMSLLGARRVAADRHGLAMAQAAALADWGTAAREGLEARRLYPRRVDLRFPLGEALLRLGRNREGAVVFSELVAADPWNANALGNLALAHERLGERERAASLFARVRELRPDDGGARDGLLRVATADGATRGSLR